MNEIFLKLTNGKYPSSASVWVNLCHNVKIFMRFYGELSMSSSDPNRHTQTFETAFYWMILLFWMKICSDFSIGAESLMTSTMVEIYRVMKIYARTVILPFLSVWVIFKNRSSFFSARKIDDFNWQWQWEQLELKRFETEQIQTSVK